MLAIVKEIVPDPFKTAILKAFATMGGVDLSNLEQLIETTAGGQETVIGLLHAVQAEFGYCPREAIVMISQRKGVPLGNHVPAADLLQRVQASKTRASILLRCAHRPARMSMAAASC